MFGLKKNNDQPDEKPDEKQNPPPAPTPPPADAPKPGKTVTVTVSGQPVSVDGRIYKKGEKIELPPARVKALGGLVAK